MLQFPVPCKIVGPIKINGPEVIDEVKVPLATFEAPLWPSVARGAKISRLCGGISAVIIRDCMTRSILLEAQNASDALEFVKDLETRREELKAITETSSRFAKLQDWHPQIVANLIFLRFAFFTADAAGHNMTTKAAELLQQWILKTYPKLKYVSISGNFCVDKKTSAVNSILGRGKHVVAEIIIPKAICLEHLRTSPAQIVELNTKKNLIGSIISGSLCSANAHFANMLFAIYLATGQDVANIVEASQGITHTELRGDDLYFSVTLPNIIVGTVSKSTQLKLVEENLKLLNCEQHKKAGFNSRRLAVIIAATVLCGELSLLAAQTNPGELMRSHLVLER